MFLTFFRSDLFLKQFIFLTCFCKFIFVNPSSTKMLFQYFEIWIDFYVLTLHKRWLSNLSFLHIKILRNTYYLQIACDKEIGCFCAGTFWGKDDCLNKVLSLLEARFDLILGSSLSMKIQFMGLKITENLGFKFPLRKVKMFLLFFLFIFKFFTQKWISFILTIHFLISCLIN